MALAAKVARELNGRRAALARLTEGDVQNYLDAMTAVGGAAPLGLVAEEWAAARKVLGGSATLREAAEFFVRNRREETERVTVGSVVERLLDEKRTAGVHADYLANLTRTLRRFAGAFPVMIGDVRPEQVTAWLAGLGATGRTAANYRSWLVGLFRWARDNGILPADRRTAAECVRMARWGKRRVEPFRPAELERLLATAPTGLLAWFAIGGLAGLRPSEICRLRWEAFDWKRDLLKVSEDVAMKTRQQRRVPIEPALAVWLDVVRRPTGAVVAWPEKKMRRLATAHATAVGVRWRKNGLRVSYGSYLYARLHDEREVAARMGHDPATFWREYREDCDKDVAEAWFLVKPDSVISLNVSSAQKTEVLQTVAKLV
jgi:integrase